MQVHEVLIDTFQRIHELVDEVVGGLDQDDLAWRPDPEANTIAWLVWHLARVQDDHVADLAGIDQVWVREGWAPRFGLDASDLGIGYGHSAAEVAAVRPEEPSALTDYHDEVAAQVRSYLAGLEPVDLDRVIDPSYDPPVTAGVRLVSVASDALQHAGQAAYVRGLRERHG